MVIVIYPTSALQITLTLIGIGGKLWSIPKSLSCSLGTKWQWFWLSIKNDARLLMYIFLNGNLYLVIQRLVLKLVSRYVSISPSLFSITSGMRLIDRSNTHLMMTNFSYILSSLLLRKISGVVAKKLFS